MRSDREMSFGNPDPSRNPSVKKTYYLCRLFMAVHGWELNDKTASEMIDKLTAEGAQDQLNDLKKATA
jgi:hypothetical protein